MSQDTTSMDRPEDSLEQQASVYEMIREDIISGRLESN